MESIDEMKQPTISIVTAVKNGAPYIRTLVESVLSQDYAAFEHIIVDDGSNDDGETVRILREYRHLRWWSRPNKGQYASQNEALSVAIGDIVCVISADDVMVTPRTLSIVAAAWERNPTLDVLYGKALHMNSKGMILPYQLELNGPFASRIHHHHLFIQHCSLFASRETIIRGGIWFDPAFKYAGDWDWIIRLLDASRSVEYVPKALSIIRKHEQQTSRLSSAPRILAEHREVLRRHGGSNSIHMAIKKVHQYWALLRIGSYLLTNERPEVFMSTLVDWWHRRSSRIENVK
ncbi:glycosyltransferase [Candidatus Saccharibacteria bacterium]|nr:glycosyltransferase [Candidatus Saccharibacteria bacterium]